MTSSIRLVVGGLIGLAATGTATGLGTALVRRSRPYLPNSHATGSQRRRDPLSAPLRQGCASIGLAVDAGLRLGPDAAALRDRVLAPLALRAAQGAGRIYPGQTEPLLLLIELPDDEAAYRLLDEGLRSQPELFSGYRAGVVRLGPVTVLLRAGPAVRDLLAAQPDRYAFCDGTFADIAARDAPPALVPLVSEHWSWRFGWDGREELPGEERHLLRDLVRGAHADGRGVRLYGIPDRPSRVRRRFWTELVAAGVDLLGSPDLSALRRFLRGPGVRLRPVASRSTMDGFAGERLLDVAGAQ